MFWKFNILNFERNEGFIEEAIDFTKSKLIFFLFF